MVALCPQLVGILPLPQIARSRPVLRSEHHVSKTRIKIGSANVSSCNLLTRVARPGVPVFRVSK